ncbi:hypothetical protein [Gordonia sp. CPCC 205333]|uniref:hypothetical protein n=1 Tax=Gordonia sp. CPCC 205333 TaxID=3140790 RepID=UPI003AF37BC9
MTTPTPDGPATVEAVAGWLQLPEGHDDLAHVAQVVPAVNAWIATFATRGENGWPAHIVQGAVMLAARITRRRNSPGGVESFSEMGATYVARYDIDIDRLLGLGGYRPLIVG